MRAMPAVFPLPVRPVIVVAAIAAMLAAGSFAACKGSRARAGKEARPNVLLISIDTCRADRLGCYGHPRATTPNLDALARQSALFSEVVSPVPITLPAHCSMLTGALPPYHGVRTNDRYGLTPENLTLAEILKREGYKTAAVVGAFVLDSQFGLNQGFDTYNDRFEEERNSPEVIAERRGEEVSRIANQWLEENADERFFLFLHYYDPHAEYDPPEPFASAFRDDPYDGEIAYADHCIGSVLEKLKGLGLYDSALIVVVGDHGESLGEHGEADHGYFVYQSVLRVPWIVKRPGQREHRRIGERVGLADLAPTILGLLGIAAPDPMQGEDLAPRIKGDQAPAEDRDLYAESILPSRYGCAPLFCVTRGGWKYIQTFEPELYDLAADPAETTNRLESEWVLAQDLARALDDLRRSAERDLGERNRSGIVLDAASIARLESLGYLAGGAPADDRDDAGRAHEDAKDFIATYREMKTIPALIAAGNLGEADAACARILAERPRLYSLHRTRGSIARREGRMEEALERFSAFLSATARQREENGMAAFPVLEEANARREMALTLRSMGRTDEAETEIRAALEQTAAHLREVLKINPASAPSHYAMGQSLEELGRIEEARRHYAEAVGIDPDHEAARGRLEALAVAQPSSAVASPSSISSMAPPPSAVSVAPPPSAVTLPHSAPGPAGPAETARRAALQAFATGKRDEGISRIRDALALEPLVLDPYPRMAVSLVERGGVDDAIALLECALEAAPDHAMSHNALGFCRQRRGEARKAVAHFREAARLDPKRSEPLNNLAWILAASKDPEVRDVEEAIALAERAVALADEGSRLECLGTLTRACGEAGRWDKAEEAARQALEIARARGNARLAGQIQARLEECRRKSLSEDPSPPGETLSPPGALWRDR